MNVIFSQDFGVLGIALVAFIVTFCVVMPAGVLIVMKKQSVRAQEQDRQALHKHA